ncbi:MAG: Asp-tRNA(Asn)/Glu-tRNA(Gln) amidotransferase subunit GatA [Saprospiraceae bacterium]|nr:Asp-tRNA(Asn)/Glu-tRNA(Gln) amidotransferase subunit GatA [Saprospiraceae bacterium]
MPRFSSLSQIQTDLRQAKLTCTEVVEYYLNQIDQHADLNIYVEVFSAEAREKAAATDQLLQQSPDQLGRLFGLVISIKDVICYKDHQVTAASKILNGFKALFSATCVERLLAEGAIIIGRTNCDEFAMGSTNESSFYGPTRNATDKNKVPGGSSGGSAVAVQADTCLASLGSDTGGSVRQPASFCGVIGMKPTYGRISRHGLLAYGSSFDQIGILAHSIEDTALLLEYMAGPDAFDASASQQPVPVYSEFIRRKGGKQSSEKQAKIAYLGTALNHPSLDEEVRNKSFELIDQLKDQGHQVDEIDFDLLEYIIPAYYVLTTAEASSNLSRYDGIRFGHRSEAPGSLLETYKKSRTEGFGREVKRRIMLGTFVLSAGYYDAYYSKAQKVRRLIQDKTFDIFKNYDFIMMPAAPGTAWELGSQMDDPVAMYLADIFTVQANMTGTPAVSLPLSIHSNGLPFGIQLMANKFEEDKLLAFSDTLMKNLLPL